MYMYNFLSYLNPGSAVKHCAHAPQVKHKDKTFVCKSKCWAFLGTKDMQQGQIIFFS